MYLTPSRSWLFASSLVLGLGLLGGFGRIIEKYCRASIAALEYFAEADAHAVQYSLIAKSLLNTALAYLEKREMQDRLRRTESSSQLFGLIPRGDSGDETTNDDNHNHNTTNNNDHEDPNTSNSYQQQHQHDQQPHYQRSIQHTNPSVGGQFGGIPGSLRGGGSTHKQQQAKPSSYPPHHNSHHNHNHHNHHHNSYHHHHHHAHAHAHTPSSSFWGNRFNNMNHDFDFVGHESTATTFLGMTESLPRTPEFSIMGGSLDSDADQMFGALNLFPLLETDGHIDLANYF